MAQTRDMQGHTGDNDKQTPAALFNWLERRYRFNYDAFASHENALCDIYSTIGGTFDKNSVGGRRGPRRNRIELGRENGLTLDWTDRRVFMNPPYGRGIFAECVQKMYHERNNAAIIVGLIKWDTSTALARFVRTFCDVWEIGRVRYEGESSAATFASAIVFPRPDNERIPLK